MRPIIFIVLLSFSNSVFAEGEKLKIFIIPAAHKIDWSTNATIITSFIKSEAKAFYNNGFNDAQRKAIGHVVAKIECLSETRWTGLSVNSLSLAPLIMSKGVPGMFAENPNGYMQSENEIKRFIVNNSLDSLVLNFPIETSDCEKMLRMDDYFRYQDKLWFAPLMDSLGNYQAGLKLGGSGATYIAALKVLDTSSPLDLRKWKEKVFIPGSMRVVNFFSVQSMYDYASSIYSRVEGSRYFEDVIYKGRRGKILGIQNFTTRPE